MNEHGVKRGEANFETFFEGVAEMCVQDKLRKAIFLFDYGDENPKMVAFNGIGWDGGITGSGTVQLEDIKMMLQDMLSSDHFKEQ